DPYANAFNESENFAGHQTDHTNFNEHKGWIWERKYEIDSLCYPIQLAYLVYKNTGYTKHFDEEFIKAVKNTLNVFKTEQNHEDSPYHFVRDTERHEDTLIRDGKGAKTAYTGMTWS
ncbi:metal-independent alpha-mannosidase, partial [Bacillus cereus]